MSDYSRDSEYAQRIEDGIKPRTSTWKEPPYSTWLARALVRLEQHGVDRLVKAFLAQMHRPDHARGLLTEILLGHSLLSMSPQPTLSYELNCSTSRQKTCDFVAIVDKIRADFECKTLSNRGNILRIGEFMDCIRTKFAVRDPGLRMHLETEAGLTKQRFKEFQNWFFGNADSFQPGQRHRWPSRDARPAIEVSFSARDQPGFEVESWAPFNNEHRSAYMLDHVSLKKAIASRIAQCKTKFRCPRGEKQFNFVVLDIRSNVCSDCQAFTAALYGDETYEVDPNTMNAIYRGRRSDGIFAALDLPWLSGVLLPRWDNPTDVSTLHYVLFPHPDQLEHVQRHWGRPPFRSCHELQAS